MKNLSLLSTVTVIVFIGLVFAKYHPARGIVIIQDAESSIETRSNINTGNNSKNGVGTIKSGDGFNASIITNIVNNVSIDCCTTPTPKPTSWQGTTPPITLTPDPGNPTIQPTQPPTGGGNTTGGGGNGGGIGGGEVQGVVTAKEQGEVLGLAATGSGAFDARTLYGLGLVCVGAGFSLKKRFSVL